jgi:hypothetical protein
MQLHRQWIAHIGESSPLYFWRDKTGNEIDLIVDFGTRLLPIEIKSAKTFSPSFRDGINRWLKLKGNSATGGRIIYTADHVIGKDDAIQVVPWWTC